MNGGLPFHIAISGRKLGSHQEGLNRVIPTAIDAGPTVRAAIAKCTLLWTASMYVTGRDRGRKREWQVSVCLCARESAPEVLLLLGRLHSTQSEVDPAPQPSRLVELGWLWRSFLRTGMGIGWAEWGLTPLDVGSLETSPPSTPGADLMCLQSRVSTWVP